MTNGRFTAEDRHLRTLFGLGAVGDLSDGQLLERFATLGGDPAELAFAALVDRHGSMVLRVARSVHPDEHGAHDAFQATFLLLARKARSLWVRDSIGPWLHAVACRVAAQHRSSEIRRLRRERASAAPEAYRGLDSEADDLGRAIHEEIDRLPERYRSAVVLCHLENLTQHEAARRLGWPVGTLQSRLARGRAKLRERLGRRGLAPTLRAFAPFPAPAALVASTARAASTLHGTGVIAPAVLAMIDATSKGMLMTKLKIGSTILVILGGLVAATLGPGPSRLARATGQASQTTSKPERPTGGTAPSPEAEPADVPSPPLDELRAATGGPGIDRDEPGLTTLTVNPRPWETVARIRSFSEGAKESTFSSGVIVRSTERVSLVLTTAHNLAAGPDQLIRVDLFDGQLEGRNPARVRCNQRDIGGKVIAEDRAADLALIRIRPDRKLPVSEVVPPGWHPARGMRLISVGCSHGEDATAWDTTIRNPNLNMIKDGSGIPTTYIQCDHQPKPGRSGGGLFAADGYLVGLSHLADPNNHTGLYATPEAIRSFLGRQDLADPARQARQDSPREDAPEPAGAPLVSDQERRLADVERKLDRIIEALKIDALKDVKGDFGPTPRKR